VRDYWNHNTAYHPWLLRIAAERPRRNILDVGCGDGLLLQRLAPYTGHLTGIEPDVAALSRAQARLAGIPNVTLNASSFAAFDPGTEHYDLITFVASLHHMDLADSLTKARDLLAPDGDLLVVGLAAERTPWDWAFAALALPWARLGSALHHETDPGVLTTPPTTCLTEIRTTARNLLPGVRIRRGLYYRYLLRWTRRACR